jgi:hypothetical protein
MICHPYRRRHHGRNRLPATVHPLSGIDGTVPESIDDPRLRFAPRMAGTMRNAGAQAAGVTLERHETPPPDWRVRQTRTVAAAPVIVTRKRRRIAPHQSGADRGDLPSSSNG